MSDDNLVIGSVVMQLSRLSNGAIFKGPATNRTSHNTTVVCVLMTLLQPIVLQTYYLNKIRHNRYKIIHDVRKTRQFLKKIFDFLQTLHIC